MLVGTWAAAEWAIRFYERHGFERGVGGAADRAAHGVLDDPGAAGRDVGGAGGAAAVSGAERQRRLGGVGSKCRGGHCPDDVAMRRQGRTVEESRLPSRAACAPSPDVRPAQPHSLTQPPLTFDVLPRTLGRSSPTAGDCGTSQLAPSSVQQRTMSRTESTPVASPLVDHDQVAEAAADHRGRALLERPVGRGEHEVGGQVVGDALGVRVLPLADRVQDVALGEDAEARRPPGRARRRRRPGAGPSRRPPGGACAPDRRSAPSCSCRPAPASSPPPSATACNDCRNRTSLTRTACDERQRASSPSQADRSSWRVRAYS